ncbi:MAG: SixA phosphatase family protein [Segniliparus sp.]|uniref:SixA phosphatase family protein n=1 Tax=Segniliparus sp. TaxID=2804064 RepID=UPI003F2E7405
MTTRKTLILLRHGKSGYPPGVPDHERPLAERGWREAALAGEWLRGEGVEIDHVLCSTARRTRETLAASAITAPVQFQRGLYGASEVEVIGFLTELPETVATALVVGHHPGMPETAEALHELTGLPPNPALEALLAKYPTSALTRIEVAGAWADLAISGGEVAQFHVPR